MLWGNTIEEYIKLMHGAIEERPQAKQKQQIETREVWLPTEEDQEPPF
tara:strand:- start:377 stop:520 length:144 start_codon:yes stop_codon:yes gene_type:complete